RFLDSPIKAIYDGAGGFRRRLDVPNPQLDFPILHDLVAQGATDYVVMPFVFSSGQVNAFSLSTKRPGGFSVADLGAIYEVLPLLSRIFEVHAMRLNAVNLLDVYLGKQSGESRLDLGVGLHVGDVMYGNIGTADRLEFSVIGAAANEAARIEAMCKTLEVSPIVSGAFASHVPDRLRSLGRHALRGVAEPQELYTLRS